MNRYAIEWIQTERRVGAPWIERRCRSVVDAPNIETAISRWRRQSWCNAEIEAVYHIGRAEGDAPDASR